MPVVSNTSPLVFLESLDVLHLLAKCFEKVIIPDAVYQEWGPSVIPSFVERYHLSEKVQAFVSGALGRLHQGELEAIELARELGIDFVLRRSPGPSQGSPYGVDSHGYIWDFKTCNPSRFHIT